MTLEYLLKNESTAQTISELVERKNSEVSQKKENSATEKDEKTSAERKEIQISFLKFVIRENLVIVDIDVESESLESARMLLAIRDSVDALGEKDVVLTKDGVSSFFNRKLYPLINEFERELRRFLYVKTIFSGNDDITKTISELEKKDFGEIHKILFCDESLVKDLHKKLNEDFVSKNEIIDYLKEQDEKSLWNKAVPDEELTPVRDSFLKATHFRNDVMHAHKMDYKAYKDCEKLFVKLNNLLTRASQRLIMPGLSDEGLEHLRQSAEILVAAMGVASAEIKLPEAGSDVEQAWKTVIEYMSANGLNVEISKAKDE